MRLIKRLFAFAAGVIIVNHFVNGFRHQAGHGYVSRRGIDAEPPQKGLGQAQRDILMRLFHRFQYSLHNIRE